MRRDIMNDSLKFLFARFKKPNLTKEERDTHRTFRPLNTTWLSHSNLCAFRTSCYGLLP